MSFRTRTTFLETLDISAYMSTLNQWSIFKLEEIEPLYENALAWGCDGLILRDPNGRYKFGRGTIKEGLIYKMKPFQTFDAKIIGIIQATEVREGAEKKINELGRSVTSKKKDDRILIEKAAAFVVMYEGKELKVTIAMTDEEKEDVWKHQNKYLGRMIEYKGMLVGSKDLPRHPVYIRMRDDK
jgi:DNA ligase-1